MSIPPPPPPTPTIMAGISIDVESFPTPSALNPFPTVTASMSFVGTPPAGFTLTGSTLTVQVTKGTPVQVNFQVADTSTAQYLLLGIYFNQVALSSPTPTPPAGLGDTSGKDGQVEFPAVVITREQDLESGDLSDATNGISFSVPPNTLSLIDANVKNATYTFAMMIQEIGTVNFGVFDPTIENDPA